MAEQLRSSFSFVHAADLHLDTPFSGVRAVAPHVSQALREASLDAFDRIVDLALDRGVAFVLIAGDIYDGADRGLRAQLRFRGGLERLSLAGISTFVVHGNHDPVDTGWSAIASWPDGVTVFGSDAVTVVPVMRDGEQIATVQGISYGTRETTENLALGYTRPEGPGVAVGLLHCNVEGSPPAYAHYSPCTIADLKATGLDYLALGHVHERSIVARGASPSDPWIVYSGNTQARSPRPSEMGAKGVYVVEVNNGHLEEPEFVACDRVRFVELEPSIADLEDLAELEQRLRELAEMTLDASGSRSVILRVRLGGRSDLHIELSRPGVISDLLAHLRETAPQREPFWWWDRLIDDSSTPLDLGEISERGDFSADLLAYTDETLANEAACDALLAELGEALPTGLRRDLDLLIADPQRKRSLLEGSRLRALDELLRPA